MYFTGSDIPDEPGDYIATFQLNGLVIHLFQISTDDEWKNGLDNYFVYIANGYGLEKARMSADINVHIAVKKKCGSEEWKRH